MDKLEGSLNIKLNFKLQTKLKRMIGRERSLFFYLGWWRNGANYMCIETDGFWLQMKRRNKYQKLYWNEQYRKLRHTVEKKSWWFLVTNEEKKRTLLFFGGNLCAALLGSCGITVLFIFSIRFIESNNQSKKWNCLLRKKVERVW